MESHSSATHSSFMAKCCSKSSHINSHDLTCRCLTYINHHLHKTAIHFEDYDGDSVICCSIRRISIPASMDLEIFSIKTKDHDDIKNGKHRHTKISHDYWKGETHRQLRGTGGETFPLFPAIPPAWDPLSHCILAYVPYIYWKVRYHLNTSISNLKPIYLFPFLHLTASFFHPSLPQPSCSSLSLSPSCSSQDHSLKPQPQSPVSAPNTLKSPPPSPSAQP